MSDGAVWDNGGEGALLLRFLERGSCQEEGGSSMGMLRHPEYSIVRGGCQLVFVCMASRNGMFIPVQHQVKIIKQSRAVFLALHSIDPNQWTSTISRYLALVLEVSHNKPRRASVGLHNMSSYSGGPKKNLEKKLRLEISTQI